MDLLSILGIIISLSALLLGNMLDGGQLGSLINVSAFIIVMGGTLGATLLHFPPSVVLKSLHMSAWIFNPKPLDKKRTIVKMINWSLLARKEGLLGLENEINREKDPFVSKGLQLLVDGTEPENIREILEVDLTTQENKDYQAARLYEAMGGYAPTIGILGAVMGLIHVMENLAEPALLGEGIATAFVATIYGVASANLLFLPMANKLKAHIFNSAQSKEMIILGLVSIAEGENPRNIEIKLDGFLPKQI